MSSVVVRVSLGLSELFWTGRTGPSSFFLSASGCERNAKMEDGAGLLAAAGLAAVNPEKPPKTEDMADEAWKGMNEY